MPAPMTEQQRIETLNAHLAAFTRGLQAAQPSVEQLAKSLQDICVQMRDQLPSIASGTKWLEEFEQAKRKLQP